jgi:hypothetical protein
VAIFEAGIQQVQSSVGTSSVLIFNPENTSATTFGPLGSVSSTAVLNGLLVQNTGTVTVFVGFGSLTAGNVSTPFAILPGGQLYSSSYSVTKPSGTTGQVWANTTTGTGSTLAGLPSVASVI